jgi:hypothetical protein
VHCVIVLGSALIISSLRLNFQRYWCRGHGGI